jgi:hypothetical protein
LIAAPPNYPNFLSLLLYVGLLDKVKSDIAIFEIGITYESSSAAGGFLSRQSGITGVSYINGEKRSAG